MLKDMNNKIQAKFKLKERLNINTEDSSDYVSSDLDITNKDSKNDIEIAKTVLNHLSSGNHLEDSNDSFYNDRDDSNSGAANRTPTININNKKDVNKARLIECLDYLHRMINRKDKEAIFEFPVTDDIAPGYSSIIKHPMDLSTMKRKIENYEYNTVAEYRDDLILMCENCMTYNKMDTIYYHAARKLLDYGLKLLSRDKLLTLRNTVRIMRYLTPKELGFDLDGNDSSSVEKMFHDIKQNRTSSSASISSPSNQTQNKLQANTTYTSRLGQNNSIIISKTKILQKIESNHQQLHQYDYAENVSKDSYLVPPEGLDVNEDEQEDIAEEVRELASEAAEKLREKNPNGKMGFLRRNSNGTTGYHFLKNSEEDDDDDDDSEPQVRTLTIGNLSDGLQQNFFSMSSFLEDKKDKNDPMYYIENGPFSSNAPTQDTSNSNLTKEETDILLSTYGDEISYEYALSLMNFAKSNSQTFNKYINLVLNTLTKNEHEKYLNYLKQKETEKQDIAKENITPIEPNLNTIKTINSNPNSVHETNTFIESNISSNQIIKEESQLVTSNKIDTSDQQNESYNFVNSIEPNTSNNFTIKASSN